jgi:hypothetical protein
MKLYEALRYKPTVISKDIKVLKYADGRSIDSIHCQSISI